MIRVKSIFIQIQDLKDDLEGSPGLQQSSASLLENSVQRLDTIVTDPDLFRAVSKLYYDGHHAQAVLKAFQYINNLVQKTSAISDDGAKLMTTVFSANTPILQLNALSSPSEKDEQAGYMRIFEGVVLGIRNPRAHQHDWEDTQERALQLLSLANHLAIRVKGAKKTTK